MDQSETVNGSERPAGIYRFAEFTVDVERRELLREGQPVELTSKVFDLLLFLVEHPGRVHSKEVLMQRVWPGRVVLEANVVQSVSVLRRALGDDDHTLLKTIPRGGYVLDADDVRAEAPRPVGIERPPRPRRIGALLAIAIAVLAVAGFGVATLGAPADRPSIRVIGITPGDPESAESWIAPALHRMLEWSIGRFEAAQLVTSRNFDADHHHAAENPADILVTGRYTALADGALRVTLTAEGAGWRRPFTVEERIPANRLYEATDRWARRLIERYTGDDLRALSEHGPRGSISETAARNYGRALIAAHEQRLEDARDLLLKIVEDYPDFQPAQGRLALLYARMGYQLLAVNHARRNLALAESGSFEGQLRAGMLSAALEGEWPAAVASARALVDRFPEEAHNHLALAHILLLSNHPERANAALDALDPELLNPVQQADFWYHRARVATLRDQSNDAIAYLNRSETIAREAGSTVDVARAIFRRALVRMTSDDRDAAIADLSKSRELYEASGNRLFATRSMLLQTTLDKSLAPESALMVLDESLKTLRDIGNVSMEAQTLVNQAILEERRGHAATAMRLQYEASELYRDMGKELQSDLAQISASLLALQDGELKRATETLETLHDRGVHPFLELRLLRAVAIVHAISGEPGPARRALEQIRSLESGDGAVLLTTDLRCTAGELELAAGRLQRARERLNACLNGWRALNPESDSSEARLLLAEVDFLQGNRRRATESLDTLERELETGPLKYQDAILAANLAWRRLAFEPPDRALPLFEKALAVFEDAQARANLADVLTGIALGNALAGREHDAVEYLDRARSLEPRMLWSTAIMFRATRSLLHEHGDQQKASLADLAESIRPRNRAMVAFLVDRLRSSEGARLAMSTD